MTTKKQFNIVWIDISYSCFVDMQEQTYIPKYFKKVMITVLKNYPTKEKIEKSIFIKRLLTSSNIEMNYYKL